MNSKKWRIVYYESVSGSIPVYDFIEALDKKAQAKIYNMFTLLEEYGIHLGGSHTKKLKGTDLWELRILGSDSIRILYIAVFEKTFLILHGFMKKKMEIPRKDIRTAQIRLVDYLERKKK